MSYLQNNSHLLDYQKMDGTIITFNVSSQHTLIKKYDLIFKQVNTILEMDPDLHILYDEFLTVMSNDPNHIDFERVKEILPVMCESIDKYAEQLKYWEFSYLAPKKKSDYKLHINKEGYLQIMKASVRSKFICVPVVIVKSKHISVVRYIYNYICREMIESGVMFTLERIIDSIVLTSSAKGMDQKSQLWVFFSTSKGVEPNNIALRERNSILYKGLPTVATGLNPISWYVAIARTSISFAMKDRINEISISFNAPIESSYENSTDMLKVFIYEEVTSNRKLKKLFNDYPWAMELINGYVFPICNYISLPFISEVFNVPNLNITHLINILLLNIFTYKYLSKDNPSLDLYKMLTYSASVKSEDLDINNDNAFRYNIPREYKDKYTPTNHIFTTRILLNIINDKMAEHDYLAHTIYTSAQIENLFKVSLKSLLSYDYYNYKGMKVVINPITISIQYLDYLYRLLIGEYKPLIEEARSYLRG